jgi:hypothetical protein
VGVNLDAKPPSLIDLKTGASRDNFDYELGAGHFLKIELVVSSQSRSITTWRLVMELTVGGRTRTLIVDDHGRPFELAGLGLAKRFYMRLPHTTGWTGVG